jgi:Fe-S cluster assembly protein SufD
MANGGRAVSTPGWLTERRAEASQEAVRLGTDLNGHEEWLYTSPKELLPETQPIDPDKIRQIVEGQALPDAWQVLVFVGGLYKPEWSRVAADPSGVVVCSLVSAIGTHASEVSAALGLTDLPESPLLALNRERWTDGLFLQVEAGGSLPGFIQILEIGSGTSWLRHLLALGEGAVASLVETHASLESGATSSHTVTEAHLPKGAKLLHVRLKAHSAGGHHYGAVVARLEAGSRLETRLYAFGGKVAREDFHVSLDGPEAFALLHGLVKTQGEEKADISIKLRHASPDCQSEQLFKALADGKSQANFHGTVYVDRDAQRTAARQSNKNILLSRDASVNSRPQLEILADDVKCSHGSATGRLDEKALQFLRCRGLSGESARKLLVHAFAGEMLLPLPEGALRERIDALLGGG